MSVDAEHFFDTLNYVLQFLQEEGFNKAEDSLRQELAARFDFAENPVSTSDAAVEDDVPDSHGCSSLAVDEVDSHWPVAESDGLVLSPQTAHKPSSSDSHRVHLSAHRSSASHHDEVDEYDSMDDPGYYRKDVVNQQRFIDTELIMDDDEEGFHEHADPSSAHHIPGSGSPASSSGSLQYSSERAQSNSPLSIPASPAVDDESWEMGPADIRLVDPVTAPQSSTDAAAPTLRRVESLSNSFKDDGDAPDSCGNSFVDSETEPSGDKGFTIDLAPPASQPPELQNVFDSLDAGPSSRHSSAEPQPQQPQHAAGSDGVPKNPLSIQTPSSNREEGGVGGFSFPITPPTSEPDQLFSSWPSFRSPTSETSPDMAGTASDEEGAAAGAPLHSTAGGQDASTSSRQELLGSHMISLSAEDEQGSERFAEEDDDVDTSSSQQQQRQQAQPAGEWDASGPSRPFAPPEPVAPQYILDEDQRPIFIYNEDYITRKYETLSLKVIHRRSRTGFEETKDFPIRINDLVAGRYQIMDTLGSAAFSRAVQALDIKTGALVCLKIIKNNKDYFDQSLDEIKLLHYVNTMDPSDENGIVRLFDYFYYKEHLFLVCELLRANLYEFQKFNRESGDPPYFTLGRIQKIANQVLSSLAFLHSLGLIHSDLKPENILIKSYSNCEVKVIDLGSSCFTTDHLSSYVQSRSYRAPEVILGLPYDQKIDIWSLGCILAELSSGFVLFQNDSLATLLARLEGILGPVPSWMVHQSKYGPRFYTRSGMLYELNPNTKRYEILVPKKTSLRFRMPEADRHFTDFVRFLLAVDPNERPTAEEALRHPWLQHPYPLD